MESATINILTPVLVSLITSGITYMGLRHQYKADLKKQEQINKLEIEKLVLQHQNEIDKINNQLSAQAKLYEQNAQTDFTKEFMSDAMRDPKQAVEAMSGMMELVKAMEKFTAK